MWKFYQSHPEVFSAALRIYVPVLAIYILSIVLFETVSECGQVLHAVKALPSAPGPATGRELLSRGDDTLVFMAAVFCLYVSCIFGFVFSYNKIKDLTTSSTRHSLLVLALVTWLASSLSILFIAPTFNSCLISEFFSIPKTGLAKLSPGNPLTTLMIFGRSLIDYIIDLCVVLTNLGFWFLAATMAIVLRGTKSQSPDERMGVIRSGHEVTSQLIVIASIIFITCTAAMGFWLKLPWTNAPADQANFYLQYARAVNVYYGVTVSVLIGAAYTSCSMYLRRQAMALARSQVGASGALKWLEDNDLENPLATHLRKGPILIAPLIASFLPSIGDMLFK